jgi:hypothetical protein
MLIHIIATSAAGLMLLNCNFLCFVVSETEKEWYLSFLQGFLKVAAVTLTQTAIDLPPVTSAVLLKAK